MSATPRTDAMIETKPESPFDFARTLERELAAMTTERDALASKHQTALSCLHDEKRKKEIAIAERDALRADKLRLDWLINHADSGLIWLHGDRIINACRSEIDRIMQTNEPQP